MANVSHNSLTGADLHEPKGVAAAAANRVYVSSGTGSGAWTQVPKEALAPTANPFGANMLFAKHELSNGSTESAYPAGHQLLNLNTLQVNQISGASLASNFITLPIGTYYCLATFQGSNGGKIRLRNFTNNTTLITGYRSVGYAYGGGVIGAEFAYDLMLNGVFTLNAASTTGLQIYTGSGYSNTSVLAGTTDPEVLRTIAIWKIA